MPSPSAGELSDPRFILFCIYGVFIVVLVFCFGSQMICGDRCPFFSVRSQVGDEPEGTESNGVIYELLSTNRKNEIDTLRAGFLFNILGNFTLKLQKEYMLKRGRLIDEIQSSHTKQKKIEEGFEGEENEITDEDKEGNAETKNEITEEDPSDNEKSTELEKMRDEEFTHISIPCPGVDIKGNKEREVPMFCAICLSEYEIDDKVCWSNNSSCTHVFHRACIVHWLIALGRRKSTMRRFSRHPSKKNLLSYEMECPCCRQEFILASQSNKQEV